MPLASGAEEGGPHKGTPMSPALRSEIMQQLLVEMLRECLDQANLGSGTVNYLLVPSSANS